jgi:DNA-directed RNA polymerase subunit E'/Rpb7
MNEEVVSGWVVSCEKEGRERKRGEDGKRKGINDK